MAVNGVVLVWVYIASNMSQLCSLASYLFHILTALRKNEFLYALYEIW